MSKKIAIIGGGNLGTAIAEGLISSGFVLPQDIIITKRNIETLSSLQGRGIRAITDNNEAVDFADYIILAVKPFQLKDVLTSIKPQLNPNKHVLISVATGVWIKDMQEILDEPFPVFRVMPNTAIAIQESMTCISHHHANEVQMKFVADAYVIDGGDTPKLKTGDHVFIGDIDHPLWSSSAHVTKIIGENCEVKLDTIRSSTLLTGKWHLDDKVVFHSSALQLLPKKK